MNNFKTTKIGLAALTIIFLMLYGYFSTAGKNLTNQYNPINQGFSEKEIAFGNLGGFHILKNISYSEDAKFHRLLIETELNRSTASPEDIVIPYLSIEEIVVADSADTPYQIKVKLSDTAVANLPKDKPLAIFSTPDPKTAEPQLIQEARLTETSDEATVLTLILTKKALFRATADNSGVIVLDILK